VAQNEVYLVAKDHLEFDNWCISEELLLNILNGRQNKVLNYDFTEEEQIKQEIMEKHNEVVKEVRKFKQLDYQEDETDRLKRDYMYYYSNREFSNDFMIESRKIKKVDDGTFTDNGYR